MEGKKDSLIPGCNQLISSWLVSTQNFQGLMIHVLFENCCRRLFPHLQNKCAAMSEQVKRCFRAVVFIFKLLKQVLSCLKMK